MNSELDLLQGLQGWYLSQCDGSWEHSYGISIETLDNPGWALKIDLAYTNLSERVFEEVVFQGNDQNDWYQCRVKNQVFLGYCGPTRLGEAIALFLDWSKEKT